MYLCSYLFDTDLNFAEIINEQIKIKRGFNELDLFATQNKMCSGCQFNEICMGGCPAENKIKGSLICQKYSNIFPLCRLWKTKV